MASAPIILHFTLFPYTEFLECRVFPHFHFSLYTEGIISLKLVHRVDGRENYKVGEMKKKDIKR